VQFGYAPAARRCVALLRAHGTQNARQIAAQAGYALGTVRVSLNALKRLDQVECNEWNEWSAR
jgi:DNA-binding IclR family transcriptional regulator